VHRVHRCVLVSAGQCIRRVQRLRERVRWVWVQRFHLQGLLGLAAVPAVRRDGPVSAMFRAG